MRCRVVPQRHGPAGATLVEVLVVLVIIAITAALLFPAVAFAKAKTRSTECLGNLRQLQIAWLQYAHDHDGRHVPNTSRAVRLIQQGVAPSWVLGNARWDRGFSNLSAGLLFPYLNDARIYHCPADISRAAGASPKTSRVRSYSLDCWLSTDLDGKGLRSHDDSRFKTRLDEIRHPSEVFAFLDEHEQSIDDGIFAVHDPIYHSRPGATADLKGWMELPSDRHSHGCNLSFVDGHAQYWRWRAPKQFRDYEQPPASESDLADLKRLQRALPKD